MQEFLHFHFFPFTFVFSIAVGDFSKKLFFCLDKLAETNYIN